MKRVVIAVALGVCGVVVSAQRGAPPGARFPSPAQQAPPQFRSRVDLVHLDVSVLDRERRPVRGLGPVDFTVLENGREQQIAVFTAVDIASAAPAPAPWMRDVAPDVRTNDDIRERRLFLLIIDDAGLEANLFAWNKVKELARKAIDRFGPSDLAAVVFTLDNRNSQDFTSDRARLLAAIDRTSMGPRGMSDIPMTDQLFYRYSVGVVESAVETLASLPDRRKAIIYLGQGVPVDLGVAAEPVMLGLSETGSAAANSGSMSQFAYQMSKAFRQAAKANVNVYTFDACGLRVPPPPPPPRPTCVPGLEVDYLQNVAVATRGRAVTNTNDFDPGLQAVFEENSSYYLLGYQSTDPSQDGKFRRIEVRVSRPGVEVRTRSGYDAEKPEASRRRAQLDAQPLGVALSGVLPKGDLPMQLQAAPFAIPGKKESAVAVILGVRQPIRETGARTIERVDMLVSAFNTDGKAFGSTRIRADVTVRAGATGLAEYEVLSRIDLKPGRYQLRIAANVGSLSTSGSLYYDIDVPDFGSVPVSLSGVMLTASPSLPMAPREGLKGVLPIIPTTRRTFRTGDQVSAFVRAYQGGRQAPGVVPLRVRLRNEENLLVMDRSEELVPAAFATARAADVNIALPVGRLAAGSYLLTIEAMSAKATVRRDVRFSVER